MLDACIGNVAMAIMEENGKDHMGDKKKKWVCTTKNWSWKRIIENNEKYQEEMAGKHNERG